LKRRWQISVVSVIAGLAMAGAFAVAGAYLVGLSARTDSIQASRAENVRANCTEQNERHDNTIRTLDSVLRDAKRRASPARREQLAQSRESTVLLINALAPKRDCEQRVREQVTASPAD
jgi:hypothetical protein